MRRFDWIVELDGDELQGYPKGVASMPAFFDELERAGFNTVHGVWRDRVTADGSLQATDPRPRLRPVPRHVLAARRRQDHGAPLRHPGDRRQAHGHARGAPRRAHLGPRDARAPGDASLPVWHFKWVDGIVERLHAKVKMARGQTGRVDKSSTAILAYLTQHNNSFDLATLFGGACAATPRPPSARRRRRATTARSSRSSTRSGATTTPCCGCRTRRRRAGGDCGSARLRRARQVIRVRHCGHFRRA